MSTPAAFARTTRALADDRARRATAWIVGGTLLLGGWSLWFFASRMTVWELSENARLEVLASAHSVASQVPGRVSRTFVTIGRTVSAGEVLVELDAEPERLKLIEARARTADLRARAAATRREIEAQAVALREHQKLATVSVREATARATEARAHSELADQQAAMVLSLRERAIASTDDVLKAETESRARRATLEALELAAERLGTSMVVESFDRQAAIAELERNVVEVEGQATAAEAAAQVLERDVALRVIAAPISGQIGESRTLMPGAVVAAGESFGTIIPHGATQAVAYFPATATGRIRVGQAALLRFDGFSWSRYGTLSARVHAVASEPSAQQIRVELALDGESAPAIPREHGLTAQAEIAVEQLSPAALVLRAATRLIDPPDRPRPSRLLEIESARRDE